MLPYVVTFNAVSLDGRMDWIQPDLGRFYGLAGRWGEDLTLVGSETVLAANEEVPPEDESAFEEPARNPADKRALLAIVDSRGRVKAWHHWRKLPYWRDAIALCSRSTPQEHLEYLRMRHVETVVAGEDKVDLRAALEELNGRFGVRMVRVDAGGRLTGALLRAGLVNEVAVMVCPSLVGGMSARSIFVAEDLTRGDGAVKLRLLDVERLEGEELFLRYEVLR